MAAPKRNRTKPSDPAFEQTRKKIQSSQLINALQDHILGRNNREDMKSTQVTAALGLLNKTLPNLQATDLTSDGDKISQPVINLSSSELMDIASKDGD